MKIKIAMFLIVFAFPFAAHSACSGSGNFYTCNDASGNSYNVSKYGNQTQVNGYNYNTGSNWSQHSNTVGNTTYENGTAANGNTWNGTIQKNGNMTTYSGTDSRGNSYYKTCGPAGCY